MYISNNSWSHGKGTSIMCALNSKIGEASDIDRNTLRGFQLSNPPRNNTKLKQPYQNNTNANATQQLFFFGVTRDSAACMNCWVWVQKTKTIGPCQDF
jgi:hypothetical protein